MTVFNLWWTIPSNRSSELENIDEKQCLFGTQSVPSHEKGHHWLPKCILCFPLFSIFPFSNYFWNRQTKPDFNEIQATEFISHPRICGSGHVGYYKETRSLGDFLFIIILISSDTQYKCTMNCFNRQVLNRVTKTMFWWCEHHFWSVLPI